MKRRLLSLPVHDVYQGQAAAVFQEEYWSFAAK